MDFKAVFAALETVCEDTITALGGPPDSPYGNVANRLVTSMKEIQEHGRALVPVISGFTAVYHHYDFDAQTPGNGYRTLVKVLQSCLLHIIHKGRYIASSCHGAFFRADHNACEMEAYCKALCQLRALLYLAQRLLHDNGHGQLYSLQDGNLSQKFVQEYTSMHKACFYGRCLGFQGFNRIASNPVQVNLTLTLPPVPLRLPLASDPSLFTTVSPPLAQWGPGPVDMRLISYALREGQDSEELLAFSRTQPPPISLSLVPWPQRQPLSPWLLIHFHGGGFVAQTSKSHENYLRSWSKDLGVPILSVDYSLSPEAPFPRALEECFYAYCWALKNCHLLGSTAERVCLAGDSAGGNLCITVSMKAISCGIRVPDGIMTAYPATLLTTDASPSRLLTLIDPLLPLGVLAKCLNAYAGVESQTVQRAVGTGTLSSLGRDTALLLSDLTQGASNWIQSFLDPMRTTGRAGSPSVVEKRSPSNETQRTSPHTSPPTSGDPTDYPDGFEPLRSNCLATIHQSSCPIIKNPFVSPLLAPNNLLRGLPPVHIVASALDALLDDSVMFAKKLRDMDQPVSLTVVEDLPHGFLSLSQFSKETEVASNICVQRMREVFQEQTPPPSLHKCPKFERKPGPSG
ncbi:lipase, hormone-sensitive a isoform 2-T3 [Polymixia lowei]